MPQLLKARICNFRYNYGLRAIVDETYNFADPSGNPANTLINLANGGGKSVITQVLLQPILPRAKVAKRKIEAYFTKSQEPAFIALEWALDGKSNERLLTGIVIAASSTSVFHDDGSDDERIGPIKYYTFFSKYHSPLDPYSISKLPFCEWDGPRFKPSSFDRIRDEAKKSKGALRYFSSDDRALWQQELSDHGIEQEAWRAIERLNIEEGGVLKRFEDLNTSDKLIDNYILDHIVNRNVVRGNAGKEDSSLKTMMQAYVKQYNEQGSLIRTRELLDLFHNDLGITEDHASNLWTVTDQLHKRVGNLFAFADAIGGRITQNTADHNDLTQKEESLHRDKDHILLEELSYRYYLLLEEMERRKEEQEQAEAEKEDADAASKTAEHHLLLLECARYYRDLVEIISKIKAIDEAIQVKENDSDAKERIASLRYSVAYTLQVMLKSIDAKMEELRAEREQTRSNEAESTKKCDALYKLVESIMTEMATLRGELSAEMNQADKLVDELGIQASRMLDQTYAEADLSAWKTEKLKEQEELSNQKCNAEDNLAGMEKRKEILTSEIAVSNALLQDAIREKNELDVSLSEYDAAEERLKNVFARYGMNFEARFSDSPKNQMSSLSAIARENIRKDERVIEELNEELLAARNGTLHLPKLAVDFLRESGVIYESVEQYLLKHIENGDITTDVCAAFLSSFPYAAYGIILLGDPDEETEAFRQFADSGHWLPSVVPVFTMSDMEQMLNGTAGKMSLFAAYAKDYFSDNAAYIGIKEAKLAEAQSRLSMYQEESDQIGQDIRTMDEFSKYGADWRQNIVSELEGKANVTSGLKDHIAELEQESADIGKTIPAKRLSISQIDDKIKAIDRQVKDYDKLLALLAEESEKRAILSEKKANLNSKQSELKSEERNKEQLSNKFRELEDSLIAKEQLRRELSDNYSLVQNAIEAPIIAGDWRELLAELNQLQSAQNAEVSRLTAERAQLDTQRKDKEKELENRDCKEAEYCDIHYSEDAEASARKAKADGKKRLESAVNALTEAKTSFVKAESDFNHAADNLHEVSSEPLPRNEIGTDFKARRKNVEQRISEVSRAIKENEAVGRRLERVRDKAESASGKYKRPESITACSLAVDLNSQLEEILATIRDSEEEAAASRKKLDGSLGELRHKYADSLDEARRCLSNFNDLLSSDSRGDTLYTLFEQMGMIRQTLQKRISQIDADLADFKHFENDLVQQCMIQGKKLFDGLWQISDKSRVNIQGTRRPMIRFKNLPKEVPDDVARESIREEIVRGREEAVKLLSLGHALDSSAINRALNDTVSDANLLRRYCGKQSISMEAYKIDQNPKNSGYRDWNNRSDSSGAERFVVCFALILALLAYTRDSIEGIGEQTSVVIMDNPFGEISSKHVLEPMFEIARTYRVQLICLSDISKSDVVSCFDVLIRAVVKNSVFSKTEQLVQAQERIEHAYSREEQTSLF